MSYDDLIEISPWSRYSKKMVEKIVSSHNFGIFTSDDAQGRGVRSVVGRCGNMEDGNAMAIYWLVDETDGVIVDAKFQVFGQFALMAATDAVCELIIGKNYAEVRHISSECIDKKLRDKPDMPAFPEEALSLLNYVLEALNDASKKCLDIPLPELSPHTPVPQIEAGDGYPGWLSLSKEKKLAVIEEILNVEVRPYVELDEGGIEVQELINDNELVVVYKGACTTCFSAVGATLSTIQQILQTKVHHDLVVIPNMDNLVL